jgi:DNA-directed RNA polymerase alpha subunit
VPPRRPPTAVGAGESPPEGGRHEDLNVVLDETLRYLMFPIDRIDFDARTQHALKEAGIRTLGDLLLRISDETIERLDIEAATRKRVLEWRAGMRVRGGG